MTAVNCQLTQTTDTAAADLLFFVVSPSGLFSALKKVKPEKNVWYNQSQISC